MRRVQFFFLLLMYKIELAWVAVKVNRVPSARLLMQAIVGLRPKVQWSALLAAKHNRKGHVALPVLPVEVWHKIFWMAAVRFDPMASKSYVGYPVLLRGAFNDKGDENEDNLVK
jgi:hypothetical protein